MRGKEKINMVLKTMTKERKLATLAK